MWNEVDDLVKLSSNFTRANFIDRMEDAQSHWLQIHGKGAAASCLVWANDELADMMSDYDPGLTTFLTKSWGDDVQISEGRRSHKEDKVINKPGLSCIVGNQPAKMEIAFPGTSWGQGFTDRMMFVFNPENTKRFPFDSEFEMGLSQAEVFGQFIPTLKALARSWFDISVGFEVKDYARTWFQSGYQPVPSHPKLEFYNNRRVFHATKLAGLFTVAREMRTLRAPKKTQTNNEP